MPNHGSKGEGAEVIDLAARRLEKEALDPKTINTSAEAVLFLSKFPAFFVLRKAWDFFAASVQREIINANPTEIGRLLMEYCPALNPRSYFLPGHFFAFFTRLGMLELKLTEKEEMEIEATLKGNTDPLAREKLEAEVKERAIQTIPEPLEGWTNLEGQALLAMKAEVPELAVVLKTAGRLGEAREGFLASVRGAVRDKRAEKVVAETQREEHNGEVRAAGLDKEERKAA